MSDQAVLLTVPTVRTKRRASAWQRAIVPPVLSAVVALGLWEAIVDIFAVPVFIVPPPSAVIRALVRGFSYPLLSGQGYYLHTGVTAIETVAGFAIGSLAGVFLGALVAQFSLVERTVYPYVLAFQTIPKPALAPLFVLWFGYGLSSKIVVTATIVFFPLVVNTIVGLRSVDQDSLDLMRCLGASDVQNFRMLKFPAALPFVFAGLDMAAIYALIGALIGEFVGAQQGLGLLLINMNFNVDTAGLFSLFIVLAAIGILLHLIVTAVERRVLFWAPQRRNELT